MFLSDLIKRANQCLTDLGLSPGTIGDYQRIVFKPLARRLEDQSYITSEILLAQEDFFSKQYKEGVITRKTYNWQTRGIRILAEVCDTGNFVWKVYSKKDKVSLPVQFDSVLQGYIEKLKCTQKNKNCKESICRRFLKSLTGNEVTTFEKINSNHVRGFIVGISKTRPKSMDDVIYTLRGFFRYLYESDLHHDTFRMLPSAPRSRDHRVLDCLSSAEISLLLSGINRETMVGKRDYAAMLLAAVSGL